MDNVRWKDKHKVMKNIGKAIKLRYWRFIDAKTFCLFCSLSFKIYKQGTNDNHISMLVNVIFTFRFTLHVLGSQPS